MRSTTFGVCLMVLVGCLALDSVSAEGCAAARLCCPGRNDTCTAEENTESGLKTCYCDGTCRLTNDCCQDYNDACASIDCKVSKWDEKWQKCSNPCGRGKHYRYRNVIQKPKNGGNSCPTLIQHGICHGNSEDCKFQRGLRHRKLRETARIIPASFAVHRQLPKYDIKMGIRRNIYEKYHKSNAVLRASYCAYYTITRSNKFCSRESWTNALTEGTTVCVECQHYAMEKHDSLCKGHGIYHVKTHWNAVDVHRCHGKWEKQDYEEKLCSCDPKSKVDFIFV